MMDAHDTNQPLNQGELEEEKKTVEVSEAITETPSEETTAEVQPEAAPKPATKEDVLNQLKELAQDAENADVYKRQDYMDTDDAVDLMRELDEDKQEEVLSHIEDIEQAGDIVDLLKYDENTAGGLMEMCIRDRYNCRVRVKITLTLQSQLPSPFVTSMNKGFQVIR